jgi:hypothetical protein
MGANHRRELAQDLVKAQRQFHAWRRRRAGGRIPEPLWALAVRLVKRHGVSRTATALRLDYYTLKQRAEQGADRRRPSSPAFLELPAPVVVGKQCLFQLDNGAGASMRMRLLGYEAADLELLTRGLWSTD